MALQCFGSVHSVHHQHHPDTSIHTGMRIVHMIRGACIPWHMYVDGWSAKGWYPGQPVKCDICGEGHVSRVRPLRGKCRFCKEEGHFACNCPNNNRNDWGEVSADGTAPANAEEGPTTPADSAPSSGAISDLRDNQLNELTGSVAPGSAALSESLNNNATSTANSNINNESEIRYIVMIVVEIMKIVKVLCIAMIVVEITEIVKVLMLLYQIIMKWKYLITLVIVTLMVLMILKSAAMHPSLP